MQNDKRIHCKTKYVSKRLKCSKETVKTIIQNNLINSVKYTVIFLECHQLIFQP